jgi:TRAP-type C4-dicarboxylate transport system permease small subunit
VSAVEEALPAEAPPQERNPVLRGLAVAENVLITVLLVGTVSTILIQVFYRYALDKPLSWSNEIATDLLVYVAFVGLAIGVRDNAHVALRLFERKVGARTQRVLRVAELAVLGTVLVCIGIGGAAYAYEQRDVVSPIGMPLWAAFAALPLGGGLGALHALIEIIKLVRGGDLPAQVVEANE